MEQWLDRLTAGARCLNVFTSYPLYLSVLQLIHYLVSSSLRLDHFHLLVSTNWVYSSMLNISQCPGTSCIIAFLTTCLIPVLQSLWSIAPMHGIRRSMGKVEVRILGFCLGQRIFQFLVSLCSLLIRTLLALEQSRSLHLVCLRLVLLMICTSNSISFECTQKLSCVPLGTLWFSHLLLCDGIDAVLCKSFRFPVNFHREMGPRRPKIPMRTPPMYNFRYLLLS